ncbi:MAG: RNA polymerase sigma factor [Lysobacteraceae bacterium]|nr:MAG: RNA polymerase sigma factor [Xanthomonadaceae bacterium]
MSVVPQEDYLMQRAARGDATSMERLYALTATPLFSYLRKLGALHADADDLLQTTFLNAWRSRQSFRGEGARPWLFTIARNAWLSHAGRNKAATESNDAGMETAENALIANELSQALERALQRLPEDTREAVVLSRVSGLGISQIAQVLGITEGNTRVRIHRGLQQLKKEVEPS